eukprot:GFKZ01009697.1.p1 GENE.GFKZ01009697.1~~GFKZ01009697.1.p1  ORF type:complete len:519 (-),score=66.27 GFKZ01009697.1:328-1656(-)
MHPITFTLYVIVLLLPNAKTAHLPAVRRSLPPPPHNLHHADEKRVIASRLIRSADRHKDRSLRDVLGENDQSQRQPTAQSRRWTTRDEHRTRLRAEEAARERVDVERTREEPRVSGKRSARGEEVHSREEDYDLREQVGSTIRTLSQLFAWAINNTVPSAAFSYSKRLSPISGARSVGGGLQSSQRRALPGGERQSGGGASRGKKRRKVPDAGVSAQDFELLNSAAESEFDVIRRNVRVLDKAHEAEEQVSPSLVVNSLLMLEELCHSIDNGRDLQISGGILPILHALDSSHETVRSSAAWALATCCQNNPRVQNASLELDAVPRLSRLAASDKSPTVRGKALFALNALLEMEEARVKFEELPFAMDVLKRGLVDASDHRATRRALNLTELLVHKNLDVWKTQLEAYDLPMVVERLMRSHPDIDVRESAARTIAALDGRNVA